jgi:chromosome segregation ATPase
MNPDDETPTQQSPEFDNLPLEEARRDLAIRAHDLARALEHVGRLTALVDSLSSRLEQASERERQLIADLSSERRTSMRLLQEVEEQRAALESELERLREQVGGAGDAPRHSVVVRRESRGPAAETLRPPPVVERGR